MQRYQLHSLIENADQAQGVQQFGALIQQFVAAWIHMGLFKIGIKYSIATQKILTHNWRVI